MAAFEWKVEWIRLEDVENPITITDCVKASISKSSEIKNNICQLTLKNSPVYLADDGTTIVGEYVNTGDLTLKFQEGDQIKVWASFITDASEVGTEWYDDARLLGTFVIEEWQLQTVESGAAVQLTAVDAAYYLFNVMWNYSYGVSSIYTAPGIIRHAVRANSDGIENKITSYTGTDNDAGAELVVEANFVSESGKIQDQRTTITTTLNGAISDTDTTITLTSATAFEDATDGTIVIDSEHIAYTGISGNDLTGCTRGIDDTVAVSHSDTTTVYQGFPQVVMSKTWTALFDWIHEVSQTGYTNYLSEVQEDVDFFFSRSFLFWIDANNKVNWTYPDDTVDLTVDLTEEGRRSFKLEKTVFDAVNLVIYNAGNDMYGHGIIHYYYDSTTEVGALKMKYQPMTQESETLIQEDVNENKDRNTADTQDELRQFPSAYPMTPTFLDLTNKFKALTGETAITDVANDTEYNDALREAAKYAGYVQAEKLAFAKQGLRYSGQIALKGSHIAPGDLISVTNGFISLNAQYLRVTDINHQISNSKWETIITVEEDETDTA